MEGCFRGSIRHMRQHERDEGKVMFLLDSSSSQVTWPPGALRLDRGTFQVSRFLNAQVMLKWNWIESQGIALRMQRNKLTSHFHLLESRCGTQWQSQREIAGVRWTILRFPTCLSVCPSVQAKSKQERKCVLRFGEHIFRNAFFTSLHMAFVLMLIYCRCVSTVANIITQQMSRCTE